MTKIKNYIILLIIALLSYFAYYFYDKFSSPEKLIEQAIKEGSEEAIKEAVMLGLKGISLSQGEGGIEFWRLKASWAGLHEKDGSIEVQKPKVEYNLGEGKSETDIVYANSDHGLITENQTKLNMWGNVVVYRGEDTITGKRLVYNSKDRTLIFPEGAKLSSPKADGVFGVLIWNMDLNEIYGQHNIAIDIKPQVK